MKTSDITEKNRNPKNFEIKKELKGKYADQSFKDKVTKAKYILKTVELPKLKNSQLNKIEKKASC